MRTRLISFVAFKNDCSENRMCLDILTASSPTCDVEETTDMAETFVVEAVKCQRLRAVLYSPACDDADHDEKPTNK